jgi:hypothetical protein
MGSTPGAIGVEMCHMRRQGGFDLPYRYERQAA